MGMHEPLHCYRASVALRVTSCRSQSEDHSIPLEIQMKFIYCAISEGRQISFLKCKEEAINLLFLLQTKDILQMNRIIQR